MTKLGIISDSHGRTARTRQALHLLLARGAERIIHLGDVESEAILDLLVGHDATVVFGNCDDEHSLSRYAQALGIRVVHPGAIIEIKPSAVDLSARDVSAGLARSIRIGVTHGHLEHEVSRLGHTHEIRDEQVGCTRVMNPGALHRAARYTVMLFDPSTGHAEWLDVE